MDKKIIIYIAFTAIVFFCLGIFFSSQILNTSEVITENDPNNTFQAGWDAARKRLIETKTFGDIRQVDEVKSLVGEILEIKSNSIIVHIHPLELLADPSLDNRIIKIDRDTTITRLVKKDQALFQREYNEFMKKNKEEMIKSLNSDNPLSPPQPCEEREINIEEFQIGEQVFVESDFNIKDLSEFKAIKIQAQCKN